MEEVLAYGSNEEAQVSGVSVGLRGRTARVFLHYHKQPYPSSFNSHLGSFKIKIEKANCFEQE